MDPLSQGIQTLLGLIVNGIQWTIPLTAATVGGLFLFNFFKKKYGWKWIGSTLASMVVGFTILFFLLHTINIYHGFSATDSSLVPPDIRSTPEFQADQPNALFLLAGALFKSAVAGVILSILILPFAFAGVAVFDTLKSRIKGVWPRIFVTCFLASLVLIVLLAAFPWILVSVIYLIFFGF